MKKLKIFLILFLTCSFLIPTTYAFEINGATFDNVRVYNSNGTLIHSVTDNVNGYITVPKNENISYYLRITGVDDTSISTGQMLIYTNICTSFRRLQTFDRIENTIGSITQLQLIANNIGEQRTCTLWNGEDGTLIQNVYSFAYNFQRDSSGNSFLDSKIYWKNSSVITYLSWTQFVNVYLAEYDETVIQNLRQQQINAETNAYLQEQIQKQQETNQKLDEVKENIGQTNQKLDAVNNNLNNVNTSIKDTQDYLKDDTAPSADINVLGNVQGILPEGPIDSLLNIPFKVLSILNSSFGGVCVPISGKFVFDSTLTIPCFSDLFYSNVPDSIMIFINVVPTAFILIAYLKNLYKRVDRALSLETSADDEWGGI